MKLPVAGLKIKIPNGAEKGAETKTIERVTQFIRWSYEPVVTGTSDSFTTIQKKAQENWEQCWYKKPQQKIGQAHPQHGNGSVWSWYDFPVVKQKLVQNTKFDPWISEGNGFFTKGAHMPLMVYVGKDSRRSAPKREARTLAAKGRGWERSQSSGGKWVRSASRPHRRESYAAEAAASAGTAPEHWSGPSGWAYAPPERRRGIWSNGSPPLAEVEDMEPWKVELPHPMPTRHMP